jgi:hypothetical protein
MGLWWKEELSLSDPGWQSRVKFSGDPSAVPKSWPVLWRYGQDWHCLQVCGHYEAGYQLHFMTNQTRRTFDKFLTARFVMVREGQEKVIFWARDVDRNPVELKKTGRMVPAHRFRPDRSESNSSTLETIKALGKIAWV